MSEKPAGGEASATTAELPGIDFSTLILSLSTTALCQMGAVADPTSGVRLPPNRVIAQQTIDTIEMLREKTRGNLNEEERKLIDSLLYELRLKFVEMPE